MRFHRNGLVALLILVLVALSSTRVLDDFTDEYTSDAITRAALTYATSRGLNALVSMMQSSQLEVGVVVTGSVTVGELLDPLNDMIERFSTVMTWVLASLAAQKVLLLLASHDLFLYLVAVLGISAVLLLFFGKAGTRDLVFRLFLVVIFVRFSLGFAVALNSGVDYLFMDQQLQVSDAEARRFQSDLINLDTGDRVDAQSIQKATIAFWEGLSLSELNRKISEGIENFINLVAIYLLKTILFPLGFFYGLVFALRRLWHFRLDSNALLTV